MDSKTSTATHLINSMIPQLLLFIFILLNPPCLADNILYSPETLYAENYLQHGSYFFRMQSDCNLVLYDNRNPIWASGTGGKARNCHCTMQSDGNLVIYEPNGKAIWASNTRRNNGHYVLILQKDRNVVIYGTSIWATGTNVRGHGVSVINLVNENETDVGNCTKALA